MKSHLFKRLSANNPFRTATSWMTFAGFSVAPFTSFAAVSPENQYKAVIDGISNLLMDLAIPGAILACIVYGLMYKFAGTNQHKKAEILDSIKGTAMILIFILTAGVLMNWIAHLVE